MFFGCIHESVQMYMLFYLGRQMDGWMDQIRLDQVILGQIGRQIDRQTDRQIDREIERQIDNDR